MRLFSASSYFFNPHAVPVFVVGLFSIILGIWVFYHGPKERRNRNFLIFIFCVSVWLIFAALNFSAKDTAVSNFWYKYFGYTGVLFIAPSTYLFAISWLEQEYVKKRKIALALFCLFGMLAAINVSTNLIIKGSKHHFYGNYAVLNKWGVIGLFIWLAVVFISFIELSSLLKQLQSSLLKNQVKILIVGLLIAYIGVIDYLPKIFSGDFYPAGYIPVFIYLSIWTYAIIHYRAMEIETVIHKTFLWFLSSAAVAMPLFMITYIFIAKFYMLNPLMLALIGVALFYIFRWYGNKLHLIINHIFRRRAYDYYEQFSALIEDVSSSLVLQEAQDKILSSVNKIFYPEKSILIFRDANNRGFILKSNAGDKLLLSEYNPLFKLLEEEKKSIEVGEIEVSSKYKEFRREALDWFNGNRLELLVPFIFKNKITAILGLGKRSELKPYTLKDIELLEKMGTQTGFALYNSIYREQIQKAVLTREREYERDLRTRGI